jgi:hypothetical protein
MLNDSRCDPGRADSTLEAGEPDSDAVHGDHQKALLCAVRRRSGMLGARRHPVKHAQGCMVRCECGPCDAIQHVPDQRGGGRQTRVVEI